MNILPTRFKSKMILREHNIRIQWFLRERPTKIKTTNKRIFEMTEILVKFNQNMDTQDITNLFGNTSS